MENGVGGDGGEMPQSSLFKLKRFCHEPLSE